MITQHGDSHTHSPREDDYAVLRDVISRVLYTLSPGEPLFIKSVDRKVLWDTYLREAPSPRYFNCHACQIFIERYGSLVTIDPVTGEARSLIFDLKDVPSQFSDVCYVLRHIIQQARVTSIFYTNAEKGIPIHLGIPENTSKRTGQTWTHFFLDVPTRPSRYAAHPYLTTDGAAKKIAASSEAFRIISRALREYKVETINQALRLLEGEHLARSERFVEPLQWFRALYYRPRGRAGENLLWRAVATAPSQGYLHPRASVVGSLLDDIAEGRSVEEVIRRHSNLLHPLRYQRPKALPSAQNVARAEKLFAERGLAPALRRRPALLEEVPIEAYHWRAMSNQPTTIKEDKVFGSVPTRETEGQRQAFILPEKKSNVGQVQARCFATCAPFNNQVKPD